MFEGICYFIDTFKQIRSQEIMKINMIDKFIEQQEGRLFSYRLFSRL